MISTKLIIVDGLPGSGKSSVCHWLEQQLPTYAVRAKFIHEFATSHRCTGGIIGMVSSFTHLTSIAPALPYSSRTASTGGAISLRRLKRPIRLP